MSSPVRVKTRSINSTVYEAEVLQADRPPVCRVRSPRQSVPPDSAQGRPLLALRRPVPVPVAEGFRKAILLAEPAAALGADGGLTAGRARPKGVFEQRRLPPRR